MMGSGREVGCLCRGALELQTRPGPWSHMEVGGRWLPSPKGIFCLPGPGPSPTSEPRPWAEGLGTQGTPASAPPTLGSSDLLRAKPLKINKHVEFTKKLYRRLNSGPADFLPGRGHPWRVAAEASGLSPPPHVLPGEPKARPPGLLRFALHQPLVGETWRQMVTLCFVTAACTQPRFSRQLPLHLDRQGLATAWWWPSQWTAPRGTRKLSGEPGRHQSTADIQGREERPVFLPRSGTFSNSWNVTGTALEAGEDSDLRARKCGIQCE